MEFYHEIIFVIGKSCLAYQDGTRLRPESGRITIDEVQQFLKFEYLTLSDDGEYSCVVSGTLLHSIFC